MKPSFLNRDIPLLTVMLQCKEPETVIRMVDGALEQGADAFGLQVENFDAEYQNEQTYRYIFSKMGGRPIYVTNYRSKTNEGKADDELADGLITLAQCGATLCDIMGDMFCKHPEELTDDPAAIEKQIRLIDTLHQNGAEVLMSSHVLKYTPAERVIEIALEQQRRGADIVKIVTRADSMEQQIENLRITHLLKETLSVPFLYLSGGECHIHRRIGADLGCCMYLCVYEHDELSTRAQPLLKNAKAIRDNMKK